jgi:hypothetical protein
LTPAVFVAEAVVLKPGYSYNKEGDYYYLDDKTLIDDSYSRFDIEENLEVAVLMRVDEMNFMFEADGKKWLISLFDGQYGLRDVALSVPTMVGGAGIEKVFEVPLSDEELKAYADEYLEIKYPELRHLVKEYHDGILLFDVSLREVWDKANQDTKGLAADFKANKKKYTWDAPRYKGHVIYAKNENVAKIAKQIVKTAHPDSVMSYLNQRVNIDSVLYVRVERGIWTAGKSAAVDKYGFKQKDAEYTPSEDFPIVITVGKVIKAPEVYTDERGQVTTDYQDHLEKQWIANLRKKYPVVIYREVLQGLDL